MQPNEITEELRRPISQELLARDLTRLAYVDDIPEEYLQANSTYQMIPEQLVQWEAEVRSLYSDDSGRSVSTAEHHAALRTRPQWAVCEEKRHGQVPDSQALPGWPGSYHGPSAG